VHRIGSDTLFTRGSPLTGKLVAKLGRWFTSAEALRIATENNAQLVKILVPHDPQPGTLGIVEEVRCRCVDRERGYGRGAPSIVR
jgi:hypothetical protein